MTTERSKPNARRLFRRLRTQFKKDSGLQKLTGADRMLIDQAALLALRARQMRDDILADKPVSDEDMVRTTNCCIRAVGALRTRQDHADDGHDALQAEAERTQARPDSGLDAIEIFLREKREREQKEDQANG
jgi:hypothetical protein